MGLRSISKRAKRKRKDDDGKPTVKKFGRFTADGVCLREVAINNRVLRIPVSRTAQSTNRQRSKYNLPHFKANGSGSFTASADKLTKRKPNTPARYQEAFEQISRARQANQARRKPIEMAFVKPPEIGNVSEQKSCYHLQFVKTFPFIPCTLAIDFTQLSDSLRTMKLPSPTWKIKMWVRNQQTTTISITNNEPLERSVTFKAKSNFFTIRVENVPVVLLGCPKQLSSVKDVQVLVNIVNTIPLTDVMVLKI